MSQLTVYFQRTPAKVIFELTLISGTTLPYIGSKFLYKPLCSLVELGGPSEILIERVQKFLYDLEFKQDGEVDRPDEGEGFNASYHLDRTVLIYEREEYQGEMYVNLDINPCRNDLVIRFETYPGAPGTWDPVCHEILPLNLGESVNFRSEVSDFL